MKKFYWLLLGSILAGVLLASSVAAADWLKTYQTGGYANTLFDTIQPTPDGGYIAAGFVKNAFSEALITKLDSNGDKVWAKAYGEKVVRVSHILPTPDGGYIAAGGTQGSTSTINFMKLDSDGNKIWAKDYGIYSITSIATTTGGGYIAAGYMESYNLDDNRNLVIRLDSFGIKWRGVCA